jgi:hypothetical protein
VVVGNTALAAKAAVVFYTVLFMAAVGHLARTLAGTSFGAWFAMGLLGFLAAGTPKSMALTYPTLRRSCGAGHGVRCECRA